MHAHDLTFTNINVVDEDKIINNLLGVKSILTDKTVFISNALIEHDKVLLMK